jgi:hypothetical protein
VTFCGTDARAGLTNKERAPFFATLLIPLFLVCAGSEGTACAQRPSASAPIVKAPLSQEQVVENLVAMDLKRAHALHAYQGTRLYRLEYHGFGGTRSAEMTVEVKYQSPRTKEFAIRSTTGSRLIIRQSIQKALTSGKGSDGSRSPKARRNEQRQLRFHAGTGYDSTTLRLNVCSRREAKNEGKVSIPRPDLGGLLRTLLLPGWRPSLPRILRSGRSTAKSKKCTCKWATSGSLRATTASPIPGLGDVPY